MINQFIQKTFFFWYKFFTFGGCLFDILKDVSLVFHLLVNSLYLCGVFSVSS